MHVTDLKSCMLLILFCSHLPSPNQQLMQNRTRVPFRTVSPIAWRRIWENSCFTLYWSMICSRLCTAKTNGALARQKEQSRPLYKWAQSAIHQIILLQRRGSYLRWLWKKTRNRRKHPSSEDSLRPSDAWRASQRANFLKSKFQRVVANVAPRVWLMQGSLAWDGRAQWVHRLSRQRPRRGCAHWRLMLPLREYESFPSPQKETAEQRVLLCGFERCHVSSAPACPALPTSSRLAGVFHTRGPAPHFGCLVSFGASEEDVIIEDVIADDSMSLAASDAEEWGGSSGEPEVLPPSQTPRPKPDAELICVLSKAVEDLGLEWSAQEEPAHGLLDEWYLPGSSQQSPTPRPVLACSSWRAHQDVARPLLGPSKSLYSSSSHHCWRL